MLMPKRVKYRRQQRGRMKGKATRGNVVNQPIEVTGITRVLSVGNYINSSIALSGYVRFRG